MNLMKRLVILILFSLLFSSCNDDENIKTKIVGEWKLVEVFNGYVHGGDFKWTAVSNTYSDTIRFTANGKYFKNIRSEGEEWQRCIGTYKLLPDSILEIESSCQLYPIQHEIELTQETLIFNIQVIEGVIREKYSLIN